ncbi:hypothetical protein KR222_011336, partial [Zaprionus bogoriensis]
MSEVCRACMSSSLALVDIFLDQRQPSLLHMLLACVDQEITADDGLPGKLCPSCICDVQAAFAFRSRYEKSREVLMAKLKALKLQCDIDIDLRCVKLEEPQQREEATANQTASEAHIQSEVLTEEHWEVAEAHIELGTIKIEQAASPSPTEPSQTDAAAKRHQFCCPHCPKEFSQSSHLNAHIRTHTGERPFQCTHCPRAFSQASNLRKHMCIHSGERPFKCPHCPKTLKRHTDLQYHVSTHLGKQIHKCPNCTRYFIETAELEEHMRYHTGERCYKCGECPKQFAYAWQLQRHTRTHTGQQPFQCPH